MHKALHSKALAIPTCLQGWYQARFFEPIWDTLGAVGRVEKWPWSVLLLGVSRWSPFVKSIRVFSVVGLAVNSD